MGYQSGLLGLDPSNRGIRVKNEQPGRYSTLNVRRTGTAAKCDTSTPAVESRYCYLVLCGLRRKWGNSTEALSTVINGEN
jgi:hypothetical protein